jgi:hypothetical protein
MINATVPTTRPGVWWVLAAAVANAKPPMVLVVMAAGDREAWILPQKLPAS